MSHHRDRLRGGLACITFAPPPMLAAFARELELHIPLYSDPGRAIYEAFGLERGSVRRVWLDPRVWARYAQLVARGQRPGWSGQDTLQLGGDAVLDPEGRLCWIYRSAGPEDRPSVWQVAEALRRVATPC